MTKDEALKLALEALESKFLFIAGDGEAVDQRAKAITAIKEALAQPEQEPWEKFCDSNCVWTDHHPDCKLAKDEPVAWDGYNLDDMCEAFNRVIEEHFHRKHPFHDPVNNDAMIALRTLRGFIPYMKRHTTSPQRKPLTDEEIYDMYNEPRSDAEMLEFARAIEAKLKEKNT